MALPPPKYLSAQNGITSSRLSVGNILHVIMQTMTINYLDFDRFVQAKNMPRSMPAISRRDSFRPVLKLVPQFIVY